VVVLKIKPGGKQESTGGTGRAVLILSSSPKVFSAESSLFERGPDKIGGDVVGVIEGIVTDKPWIVGIHIAVDQV
jgi:hypothetical protein